MKIPMIMQNDKEAVQLCIKTCNEIDKDNPRVIRIRNTLQLDNIEISRALLKEAEAHPDIEITGTLHTMTFNEENNFW